MMEEGEEEDEEEEGEEEEHEIEISKPRKRIGRPPKAWSSILLPKEVTATLGTHKPRSEQSQKGTTYIEGDHGYSKVTPAGMVGQTVHGVVDGCFDAGLLVSLRMGDSDHIYHGVVFGPGLSIPVSKETDIAKTVKQKRRKQNQLGAAATFRGEPSLPTATISAPPPREDPPPSNLSLMQHPQNYEALPPTQHHPNSTQHALENPHIGPFTPQPHHHQLTYNGNFRSPCPHPDMNVNPFIHSGGFPPRPNMPMPPSTAQGYSPRQNFGHIMPSSNTPYGYNFACAQVRPRTPLPQYRAPMSDPQYRGP